MPRNPAFGPKSTPNQCISGTGEPSPPPPQVGFWKPKLSMATAPARVTTERLMPRTRTAEIAVRTPRATATAMPASAASGKVMPKLLAMCEIVKPAAPARASWMIEIWPTKPVMTTSDSAIRMPISVLISALRKSNGNTTSSTAAPAPKISAERNRCCGRGALRQPGLLHLAAAGNAAPAPEQHADDDEEREQVRRAGNRDAAGLREPGLGRRELEQRVEDADAEGRRGGQAEGGEPRDQRGGQRRDDLQRQRLRVELGDRRCEDAERAGQERGDERVRRARSCPATPR